MWKHVVTQKAHPFLQRTLEKTDDGPEGRREKRMPPLNDDEVGLGVVERPRCLDPGNGIERIDDRLIGLDQRSGARIVLSLARKEKLRVLPRQGDELDVMPNTQGAHQERGEVGNAAAKRIA